MIDEQIKPKIVSFLPFTEEYFLSLISRKIDPSKFSLQCCKVNSLEDAISVVKDATMLLHGPVEPYLSREILESANKLELVQFGSIGYAQIDLEAATELNIPVANNAGFCATSVVEYTIYAILSLLRKMHIAAQGCKEGRWNTNEMVERLNSLFELDGKTLGILGLGSIGKKVAKCASGFGCKIIYNKRNQLIPEEEKELGVEFVSFEDLVKRSDIISIHVPLNNETRGLINKEVISKMKDSVYLINTARSAIVDEEALFEALKSGKLGGVCLDVPRPENERSEFLAKFKDFENVLITPHISSLSFDSEEVWADQMSENVRRVLEGETPLFILNNL
jgi:D-3-phosphoglycerate dehydrogenase